jgi:hypothetical protein
MPDGLASPQLPEWNGKTNAGEERGLQDVRLRTKEVLFKGVNERGRLVWIRLAMFAVEDHEGRIWVDARQRAEEGAGQECAVEHRCSREASDAEKGAEHENHEQDVGDVLEASEAILKVPAEDRAGKIFCGQRGEDTHGDAGNDGTADEPAEVGIAVFGDGAQVVNNTAGKSACWCLDIGELA